MSGEFWSISSLGSSGGDGTLPRPLLQRQQIIEQSSHISSLNFILTLSVILWNESGTFRGMLPTIAALMALSMTPQIESSFRSERQHNFGVYLSIFSDGWRKSYVEGLPSFVCCTLIVHLTISNLTFRKHTNLWEDIQFSFKV